VSQWSQGDRCVANLKFDRVPYPPYSPDLSPCGFWLFEMLRQKIKDRMFQTVEEIMTVVHRAWDELTLDDLQFVFFNWIERLEWVSEHRMNITQTNIKRLSESLSHGEIEGRSGTLFTSYVCQKYHAVVLIPVIFYLLLL
jgi:hypothetical protein